MYDMRFSSGVKHIEQQLQAGQQSFEVGVEGAQSSWQSISASRLNVGVQSVADIKAWLNSAGYLVQSSDVGSEPAEDYTMSIWKRFDEFTASSERRALNAIEMLEIGVENERSDFMQQSFLNSLPDASMMDEVSLGSIDAERPAHLTMGFASPHEGFFARIQSSP